MYKQLLFFITIVFFLIASASVSAQEITTLDLDSEAAVLMDGETGQILYGKNETKRMYPASITKIATAIYALEKGNLQDQVTISEEATHVAGTRVYLEPGEVVSLEKLIIGMLVNSGNDAAYAIAEHIDGDILNFSRNINRFLREKIGVKNTNFTNPHGLFAEDHYTTPVDMGLITRYAMKNEQFRKYFRIKEYEWNGLSWQTTLHNHHRLVKGELPFAGITGGKNGFVNESGHTLVTTAERNERALIVVTMKAMYRDAPYYDTMKLLEYGFNNFRQKTIPANTLLEYAGEEYLVPNDIVYWERDGGTVAYEVGPDGVLYLKDEVGKVLNTFQLTPQSKPETVEVSGEVSEPVADFPLSQRSQKVLLIGGGVIALSWIGWLFWRRKNMRKKRMRVQSQILLKINRR